LHRPRINSTNNPRLGCKKNKHINQEVSMYLRTKHQIGMLLVALLCSVPAMATPITYTFTTGALCSTCTSSPTLLQQLSAGAYVSGSFTYDSDGSFMGEGPIDPSGHIGAKYQAVYNMDGSLYVGGSGASYTFSATQGETAVANNGLGILDLFLLENRPDIAPINGFTLGPLPLYRVRLFWVAQAIGNAPDFLSSNDLPNSPPNFSGRLALDFGTADANGLTSDMVFFDGLTVTAVPLPGTAVLLMSGMFTLFGARFRRRGNLAA
jgi:hypothetical protein